VPDWEQMLRERLGGMKLEPAVQQDVIAELAGHLEEAYETFLGLGISAEEAKERAWTEASNSRTLARKICRAKRGEEKMKNPKTQIWLPGLVTTGLATALLTILDQAGMKAPVAWVQGEIQPLFYMPWLFSLPVFGFVGAYWSGRAGGGKAAKILAGIFPSIIYFAVPFLWPLALAVDPDTPAMAVVGWGWYLLNWAALPCIALLVGALPAAMTARSGRAASQTIA
jgi:hypothetical protein